MTVFVGWQFPATGVTTGAKRTMPDRLSDVINVKDWGALGNNSADDRQEIQAAIDYAIGPRADGGTGGRVFFPPGRYMLKSSPFGLVVGSNTVSTRVDLVGCGQGSSSIEISGGSGTFVVSSGGLTNDCIGRIEGLRVDAAGLGGGSIKLLGTNQAIEDCYIGGYVTGVDASGATGAYIVNCQGTAGTGKNPPNVVPHGAVNGTWLYLGDLCCANNCSMNEGACTIVYALSGNGPSLVGCRTETQTVGVRVGWGPSGGTPCTAFSIIGQQTERCDVALDLYDAHGGFIMGWLAQGNTGADSPEIAISAITWSGGVATATSTGHNIPNGTRILQLYPGTLSAFFPSYGGGRWVVAAVSGNNNQFTYDLPSNPGTYPGSGLGWMYPELHTVRCRDVTETALIANPFGQNSALSSLDLDYDGYCTSNVVHRNNLVMGFAQSDGIILPGDKRNLAGWNFVNCYGGVNPLQGQGGWTGSAANSSANGQMVFANLPGQSGVFQPGPYEGQEFDIKDSPTAAASNFAANVTTGGGSNHVHLRYDGTNWKISG